MEFKDKVADITGTDSGIGRAIAHRCIQEGMKVILADVQLEALTKTEASMKASGATVLAVRTDVSQATDIEALAQKTLEAFGAVHLLCTSAGTGTAAAMWEGTIADWEWVKRDQFYVLTYPEAKDYVRARMEDILQGRIPTPPEP